jgi:hypothetical protein
MLPSWPSCCASSVTGWPPIRTGSTPPYTASSAAPGYDIGQLRTDLARFGFLLGDDLGGGETRVGVDGL